MRSHRRNTYRRAAIPKIVLVPALCLLVGVSIASCAEPGIMKSNASGGSSSAPVLAKQVQVQTVAKHMIGEPQEQQAEVLPSEQSDLSAQTAGTVQQILKKRGDFVHKGDLVVKIHSDDAQLQYEKAKIALQSAQNALYQARSDLSYSKRELGNSIAKQKDNIQKLTNQVNIVKNNYDLGKATRQDVNTAEDQLQTAQSDLLSLQHNLNTLQTSAAVANADIALKDAQLNEKQSEQVLSGLDVKSPISGVIANLSVEPGAQVKAGATIGTIENMNPIVLKAQLTYEEVQQIQNKKTLNFHLPNRTKNNAATISFLSTIANAQDNTFELDLSAPNDNFQLKPGMTAQIELMDSQDLNVLTVPSASILKEGTRSYVYVVHGDHVKKTWITIGRTGQYGSIKEVTSGLNEGEKVVISGQKSLVDNDVVSAANK